MSSKMDDLLKIVIVLIHTCNAEIGQKQVVSSSIKFATVTHSYVISLNQFPNINDQANNAMIPFAAWMSMTELNSEMISEMIPEITII